VTRSGEEGYALVAAVASIGLFAALSLALIETTRFSFEDVGAEQAQLQAGGAADAGVALALSGLLKPATERWSIDGRLRTVAYGDARLRIRIEDERGKVPINLLDEKQATRLLEGAGLGGDRLLVARDSLLDWTDADDVARLFGAEAAYYRPAHTTPANGFLASIDELGNIRGFDAALVARLRPYVTVNGGAFGGAGFDRRFADPRALAVMDEAGAGGADAIDRRRELAGERTAIDFTAQSEDVVGRPLTIDVDARLPDGAHAARRAIVMLTGSVATPYVVRAYE